MSKKHHHNENDERAAMIASTMMAFDDSVKDAIKEYGKFFVENMYNASPLAGDEKAQKLVEMYVTNRANKIAEHSDVPGGYNAEVKELGDKCVSTEIYEDKDGNGYTAYDIPLIKPIDQDYKFNWKTRPMINIPKEGYDPNYAMSLPADIFDINAAIATVNIYHMCGMPALVVGKIGLGYCVFTSGITYEELMDKKDDADIDVVIYTDGIRVTTLKIPESYEAYYLLYNIKNKRGN